MNKPLEALIARILKLAALAEQTNINESSEAWVAYLNEVCPANVRELIAALEQSEKQRESWKQIAQMNTVEREKDIAELDVARKRIAELEARQPLEEFASKIADCDPEVYEKGVSACLVAIPKEVAEVICRGISAASGCKVDWHYIGGRVHIKAIRDAGVTVVGG